MFPHIPSISFSLSSSLSKHTVFFWTFPPHAGFHPSLLWASGLLTATSPSWFLVLLSSVWLLWMMQPLGNNSTASAGAPRAKDISCKYLHFLQGCVVWGQRIYSIYIYITVWVFAHGVIQNFPKCQQDKVAISYFWTGKFCHGTLLWVCSSQYKTKCTKCNTICKFTRLGRRWTTSTVRVIILHIGQHVVNVIGGT